MLIARRERVGCETRNWYNMLTTKKRLRSIVGYWEKGYSMLVTKKKESTVCYMENCLLSWLRYKGYSKQFEDYMEPLMISIYFIPSS